MIKVERHHRRMLRQQRMHGAPQVANSFAVNDADLKNPPFLARLKIIAHEIVDFARAKRVQIQHPVNRQFDWTLFRPSFICDRLKG